MIARDQVEKREFERDDQESLSGTTGDCERGVYGGESTRVGRRVANTYVKRGFGIVIAPPIHVNMGDDFLTLKGRRGKRKRNYSHDPSEKI